MNGWYEKGRQSLYKMGHRWERTWKKKALEKMIQAVAAQIKLSLQRNVNAKKQSSIITHKLKHFTLPYKQNTLD